MIAAVAVLLSISAVAPARAAFPGSNGLVVFTSGADLHVVNPDGTGVRPLTTTPVEEAQAAWSPDGQRIAFRVGTPDTSDVLQIATMNSDGSGRTTITSGAAHSTQPGWSHDGKRIVFRRSTPGDASSGEVWVMDSGGANPRVLVSRSGDERYPAFSPDGGRLVFTSRASALNDVEIIVAAVDGSAAQAVTSNDVFDSAPAWSPDGARIAIERGPKGDDPGNDIWTIAATGGDERRVTTAAGLDEGPAFAPDGTRIAFATERDGSSDIWSSGPSGEGAGLLAALPGGEEHSADWQPLPVVAAPVVPAPAPPPSVTPFGRVDLFGRPAGGSDLDGDGLDATRERALGSSPLDRDSDDDGLSDGIEVRITRTRPARRDTDRDGLTDGQERGVRRGVRNPPGVVRGTDPRRLRVDRDPRTRTSPLRRDTDRDGVADGVEDRNRNGRRDRGESSPLTR